MVVIGSASLFFVSSIVSLTIKQLLESTRKEIKSNRTLIEQLIEPSEAHFVFAFYMFSLLLKVKVKKLNASVNHTSFDYQL